MKMIQYEGKLYTRQETRLCECFGVVYFRNKEEISDDRIDQARVFVVAGPREKFTGPEVNNIMTHLCKDCLCM